MEPAEALECMQQATQWLFTRHAKAQMRLRDIYEEDVRHAVEHATYIAHSTGNPGAFQLVGPDRCDDELVVIICVEVLLGGGARNVIVTAWAF